MPRQLPRSKDEASLINALSENKDRIGRAFRDQTLEEIVRLAVGSNTFRAFRDVPQPAIVFREWAIKRLGDRETIRTLVAVHSQADFDKWLEEFAADLAQVWRKRTGHRLEYGHRRKLTDLLLKGFARWKCNGLDEKERERLILFLHVALDSDALRALKPCVAALEILIRSNATMKSVKDKPTYDRLQSAIRDIAKKAGVPPIYFDMLVWDLVR